ncbi:M-phase phosphoprotein 8-like isoform X2 [Paramacrobiotus metropolitanus]|uniref:M-phase phosphoprotein 8-like isoform X2 n=1 Tax=Paramacrobiotus metropolitanus TaxID=2943436 RepID=UPI0024463950|nr:M-phase phosphoprotein 8-like isoform X2 [Paramacrobiotus metropolitanus]
MPAIKVPQMPPRRSSTTDTSSGVRRETSRATTKTPSVERSTPKRRSSTTKSDMTSKRKRPSKTAKSQTDKDANKNGTTGKSQDSDTAASSSTTADEPIYEVEQINGKKTVKGKVFYLVKWLNWPKSQSTWEPAEHVAHCHELIQEYDEFLQNKKTKRASSGRSANKRSEARNSNSRSDTPHPVAVEKQLDNAEKEAVDTAGKLTEAVSEPSNSTGLDKLDIVLISEDESDHSPPNKIKVRSTAPVKKVEISLVPPKPAEQDVESVDIVEENSSETGLDLADMEDKQPSSPASEVTKEPSFEEKKVETADKETEINFPDAQLSEGLMVPIIDYDKTADANLLLDLRRLAIKVQKLVGMSKKPGDPDLHVVIHFDGSPSFCRSYPLRVVRRAIPEKLIEFYESSARILNEF